MPLDKVKIVAVHEEVRACFKGQLKSGNKVYQLDFKPGPPPRMNALEAKAGQAGAHWKIVSAMPNMKKREFRNKASDTSDDHQDKFYKKIAERKLTLPLQVGYHVLNQKVRAGNCGEMAAAAAYVVALRKVGTPWIVDINLPGEHVLCLVNGGETPNWKNVRSFLTAPGDAWIIDPWANICCKQQEYAERFAEQMLIWSHHGKLVWYVDPKGIERPVDPASPLYLHGFENGPLVFEKCEGTIARALPRALSKLAEAKPLPGANGRWSPDDDWDAL